MRNRCVGGWWSWRWWGARSSFHKDPRLRRTRKSPNLDLSDCIALPMCQPGEEDKGEPKWNQRQRKLTDGEIWTDVCSRQIERSVCMLNPPCREKTARLPRGLSWSDPVACMETPNSVTSFVSSIPPQRHPTHPLTPHPHTSSLLPAAPPLLTWIWLAAACSIHPQSPWRVDWLLFELRGR